MFKFINKNLGVILCVIFVAAILIFPVWSHQHQANELKRHSQEIQGIRVNDGGLLGASTFFAQNASVQGNLTFLGEIKPDGSTCANSQVLKRVGANDWDCSNITVASNSLDWDEIVTSMTLDTNTSSSFSTFNLEFNLDSTGDFIISDSDSNWFTFNDTSGASTSRPFEISNYASASQYLGSAFPSTNCTGFDALQWSTTGLFTCSADFEPKDADLDAIAAFDATAGYVVETGAATYAKRTLTGTTNQISITNGDGTVGNPVFSVPSLFSITTASLSANFEAIGYASASLFQGSAFSGIDCNDATDQLLWSGGVFTCETLADADIPDAITVNGGTIGNNTLSSGATFTGSASITANFEVVGYASASRYFGGFASHQFNGTIVGPSANVLSVGTIANKLKNVVADVVRAITSFFLPTGTSNTFTEAGQIYFDTSDFQIQVASTSANNPRVISTMTKLWSFSVASTAEDLKDGGRIPLSTHRDKFNISEVHCGTDTASSSVRFNISDWAGNYDSESIVADYDGVADTSIDTNSSYAGFTIPSASLEIVDVSATNVPDYFSCSIWGLILPE